MVLKNTDSIISINRTETLFMKIYKGLLLFFIAVFSLPTNAQIDGDNIFGEDQIITIELNFNQVSFWDSLELNYESAVYMKADLTLTDASGISSFQDVGVRLKGNSSYNHPNDKKSFKIDFNEYTSGQNYDGLKKLNFSNGFKDPSVMREKLYFDICREVGVPAPRASFANVYFNGTLWGFYTVVEQIDDQFLDWKILDDDGNLFKAGDNFGSSGAAADLNYYGTTQPSYEDRYELKTNEVENDWTDLIDFIDFINNSSDEDFNNNLEHWIDLDNFLKSAAIDNLFGNLDSYTGSARNYYIYHNLTTEKWEWIKWDGNETFGSYSNGVSNMISLDPDYHNSDRPLLERIFDNETFYAQYLSAMCEIQEAYFNESYMNAKIDATKSLIQASVYADNNKMYSDANFDTNVESNITSGGGPMGGTTYGLKSFVADRSSYISGAIDCTKYISVEELIKGNGISVYPNPSRYATVVSWENTNVERVELRNVVGQLIYSVSTNGLQQLDWDVSNLESGIYIVNLYAKDSIVATEKLLIQH